VGWLKGGKLQPSSNVKGVYIHGVPRFRKSFLYRQVGNLDPGTRGNRLDLASVVPVTVDLNTQFTRTRKLSGAWAKQGSAVGVSLVQRPSQSVWSLSQTLLSTNNFGVNVIECDLFFLGVRARLGHLGHECTQVSPHIRSWVFRYTGHTYDVALSE
jgi:hypothetical protein